MLGAGEMENQCLGNEKTKPLSPAFYSLFHLSNLSCVPVSRSLFRGQLNVDTQNQVEMSGVVGRILSKMTDFVP